MSGTVPDVGVHPTATDRSMPVLELAREAEARGFRSLYFPEHTHVPVESMQITPQWRMDERYQRSLDPYIASAFVASVTSLEVGTGISLVAQHDAIALAKAIATLEHLAPGRVLIGVGFGYNRMEAEDHGIDFDRRTVAVEETVRLMRALWTDDEAVFEGRFRRVSSSWSWPKPAQGRPPVLLGARHTAQLRADGRLGRRLDPDGAERDRRRARAAGAAPALGRRGADGGAPGVLLVPAWLARISQWSSSRRPRSASSGCSSISRIERVTRRCRCSTTWRL